MRVVGDEYPLHLRTMLVLLLAVFANPLLLFANDQPILQSSAAFLLMVIAPGLLLAALILDRNGEGPPLGEWLSYGVGIGFGVGAAVVFLLGMLPGSLTQAMLLAAFDAIILAASVLAWVKASRRGGGAGQRTAARPSWPFVAAVCVILLLAAGLRLTNLGYSQFQGDEATPIVRASAFVQDGEDTVFLQPRGPVDMMIPAAMMVLGGAQVEVALRLPFALANIVAVIGVLSLGALLAGRLVGLIAGLMMALDGFALAFGRVMHYESVILVTTTASIMALYRVWMLQRAQQPLDETLARRYVWIAALLAATAALAHYDAAIVLIAGGYLVFEWWRAGLSVRQIRRISVAPGIGGLGIVAAFYIAFVLHPNFSETLERYSESLLGDAGLLVNNLLIYAEHAAFYHGAVQFYFLLLVTWAAACLAFWRQRSRWWGRVFGAMALALPVILVVATTFAIPSDMTALWMLVLGVGVVFAPSTTVQERLLWLWFGAPFWAAMFLTAKPGLHFYLFSPPLALLIGMTVADLHRRLSNLRAARIVRGTLVVGLIVLVAVNSVYLYRLFVSTAEYAMQSKAEQRAPWLWPTSTLRIPILYYGMPYDGGWRAIDALYADGVLKGSYVTNIDRWITDWYTRGAEFCRQQPDYVIVDRFSQPDSAQRMEVEMGEEYSLFATIMASPDQRLLIYSREEVPTPKVFDLHSAALQPSRRGRPTIPITPWSGTARLQPLAARFGDDLALTGVRVDISSSGIAETDSVLRNGEHLSISLGWRLLQATPHEYTVFIQLLNANAVKAGQRDAMPACNAGPTTRWRVGRDVTGHYRVTVNADAPPGVYSLIVGVYDAVSQERLYVYDNEGALLGDALPLREFQIE